MFSLRYSHNYDFIKYIFRLMIQLKTDLNSILDLSSNVYNQNNTSQIWFGERES